ncbi:MAG TPA: hypothetical protein VM261_21335 [Kofleriaceae bacterium]|nr:hypothetical protein [Kofleriaceae bacterium]
MKLVGAMLALGVTACAACVGNVGKGDDAVGDDDDGNPPPLDPNLQVQLVPASGQSGTQVVNFAVPLRKGMATTPDVRVASGGTNLATYRRGLGAYDDGSLRAIQIQVELAVSGPATLDLEIGASGGGDRDAVDVATTLVTADGTDGPKVWALLPAAYLAGTGAFGSVVAQADVAGTPLDAFGGVCDYERWNTAAFEAGMANREVWLFDRVTAMYRGYAITGDAAPLASAYREAAIYRAGLTGDGAATRIGVPGAADDLKYHYAQGMALHWLLTGDDRFREGAEDVATRAHGLWTDPGYGGGADFWTERHAGFALLAYEAAAAVSDDQAAQFRTWADEAVAAYLEMQDTWPASWTDRAARCFAHTADAHGEDYGYDGCSPWMSAILADALEMHAIRVGGAPADRARASIVRLGRLIARDGRDGEGKPYYWMGLGRAGEVDDYEEHWGESAYIVAMAWHWSGRSDAALRTAADELMTGLRERGEAGQVRSFNWQCRSAVQAPAYLK